MKISNIVKNYKLAHPHYIKLYNNLKRQIIHGIFSEGALLPSENELRISENVARSTVRQALNELVKDGYITKKKGLGSIVNSRVKSLGLLSFKGFSDVVGETNRNVKTSIITPPAIIDWEQPFFYQLNKKELSAGCIYVERIRFVNEDQVMLEQTYIPNINLQQFCEQDFINGSLFRTLSITYHIEINDLVQDLRAIEADNRVARYLNLSAGAPVLHIYRKYITNREDLRIYSSLFCNTKKYAIGSNYRHS